MTACVLIVDAGLGNIGSVVAAYERLGVRNFRIRKPPSDIAYYTHLILPGVGSFSAGMDSLNSLGWSDWLKDVWLPTGRPLLGICLGMQLLASRGFEGSDSGDSIPGLDLISGNIVLMSPSQNLVLPHVGWNSVHWSNTITPLSLDINSGCDFYFVHSYTFRCDDDSNCLATSHYGSQFSAVVSDISRNVWGMQFHPEKSQKFGKCLLQNFIALNPC